MYEPILTGVWEEPATHKDTHHFVYRGTSLIRKRLALGTYSRTLPMVVLVGQAVS